MRVVFYKDDDGKEPVREFLDSLQPKMRAKMLRVIKLLADNGNTLREPFSKNLRDGIFELRAVGDEAVLTHGFVKKTEKTPPAEIERAKKCRSAYNSK